MLFPKLLLVLVVLAQTQIWQPLPVRSNSLEESSALDSFDPDGWRTRFFPPKMLSKPKRRLEFPADRSPGALSICDGASFMHANRDVKTVRLKAQGVIVVPAGKFVVFYPNHNYFREPGLLDKLPPDAFDSVVLRFVAMEDSDYGLADKGLVALKRFTGIRALDLAKSEVTDKALAQLLSLKELESIDLFGTTVDGSFLKSFAGLPKLRAISMNSNTPRLANFKYLSAFPHLEAVSFSRNSLTDEAVKQIAACKKLQYLDISNNPGLSDAIVPTIARMTNLKLLDISCTAVSVKGFRGLTALKLARIESSQGSSSHGKVVSGASGPGLRGKPSGDMQTIFGPLSRDRDL